MPNTVDNSVLRAGRRLSGIRRRGGMPGSSLREQALRKGGYAGDHAE